MIVKINQPRIVRTVDFKGNRLNMQERTAIRELKDSGDAIAIDFVDLLDTDINLFIDDEDVRNGLNYFASKGIFTPERIKEIFK
jgi:hypothetical protein